MNVVSAKRVPDGRAKTRPVPADFLPAAAAVSLGRVQALENLYESKRNTNVTDVTEPGDNPRENINQNWVPQPPNMNARRWPQGPIHGVFAVLPGRGCRVKGPFVAV